MCDSPACVFGLFLNLCFCLIPHALDTILIPVLTRLSERSQSSCYSLSECLLSLVSFPPNYPVKKIHSHSLLDPSSPLVPAPCHFLGREKMPYYSLVKILLYFNSFIVCDQFNNSASDIKLHGKLLIFLHDCKVNGHSQLR